MTAITKITFYISQKCRKSFIRIWTTFIVLKRGMRFYINLVYALNARQI